jgi:hypothetical protein
MRGATRGAGMEAFPLQSFLHCIFVIDDQNESQTLHLQLRLWAAMGTGRAHTSSLSNHLLLTWK